MDCGVNYKFDYEIMIEKLINHFKYYDIKDSIKLDLIKRIVMQEIKISPLLSPEIITTNYCIKCGNCCRKQMCFNLDENNKCLKWMTSERSFLCSRYPFFDGYGEFSVFIDSECYYSRKLYIKACEKVFRNRKFYND